MCTRNVHSYRPRGLVGWCLLGCGYIGGVFAVLLIAANIIPYYHGCLTQLRQACVLGTASWLYYYYCHVMIAFCGIMVYYNFYLAIFTAPGYVSAEPWARPPVYEGKAFSDNPFEVRQLDREGKLRYCGKCERFKPDNAHHCNMCNHCVYRMDHHCPWINNCVGRDNGKYFLLFLAYIPLGAFHVVFTTLYSCYAHFGHIDFWSAEDNFGVVLLIVTSLVLSSAMAIAFAAFACHFLFMAYRGQTSVSKHIAKKTGASDHAKLNAIAQEEHVYDLFGADRRWWKMIFPFAPIRDGRGLLWETCSSADMEHLV